jgi:hypothetical protein
MQIYKYFLLCKKTVKILMTIFWLNLFLRCYYYRHCGLDPQSPVYKRRLRVKPAMTQHATRNDATRNDANTQPAMTTTRQRSPHATAGQFINIINFYLILKQNHNKKSCYFVTIPWFLTLVSHKKIICF